MKFALLGVFSALFAFSTYAVDPAGEAAVPGNYPFT